MLIVLSFYSVAVVFLVCMWLLLCVEVPKSEYPNPMTQNKWKSKRTAFTGVINEVFEQVAYRHVHGRCVVVCRNCSSALGAVGSMTR